MPEVMDDMVAICRLFSHLEKDAVCCGSVSVAQCAVLQDLLDGAQDVSTLAQRAQVTKGGMTRLLDGLVKRNFVLRGRDEDDRRRVIVALTPAGRTEALRLQEQTRTLVQAVLSQLSESERVDASKLLHKIRQAMGQLASGTCC